MTASIVNSSNTGEGKAVRSYAINVYAENEYRYNRC
jgi:hypothetical protein